jgi:hypothetical protein
VHSDVTGGLFGRPTSGPERPSDSECQLGPRTSGTEDIITILIFLITMGIGLVVAGQPGHPGSPPTPPGMHGVDFILHAIPRFVGESRQRRFAPPPLHFQNGISIIYSKETAAPLGFTLCQKQAVRWSLGKSGQPCKTLAQAQPTQRSVRHHHIHCKGLIAFGSAEEPAFHRPAPGWETSCGAITRLHQRDIFHGHAKHFAAS